MAAPTSEQVGVEFLLKADSTLIGGSTSATRTRTTDMANVTNKDSGRWQERQAVTQEETIEFESMFLESTTEQTGQGLTLKVSDGAGTPTFSDLKGVNSVTLTLSHELISVVNNDTSRWREILPSTRSFEFSIDRDYVDPESDTAFDHLLTMADNGESREVQFDLDTFEFDGDVYVSEEGLETPHDDAATSPLTLVSTGKYSTLSDANQDSGLTALIDALVADPATSVTTLVEVQDAGGSTVSGATKYSVDAFVETIEIEFPIEDAVNVSGTLQNDGAPTRNTQT